MLLDGKELLMSINSPGIVKGAIKLLKKHKIRKMKKEYLMERYALTLGVMRQADNHYQMIRKLKGE